MRGTCTETGRAKLAVPDVAKFKGREYIDGTVERQHKPVVNVAGAVCTRAKPCPVKLASSGKWGEVPINQRTKAIN